MVAHPLPKHPEKFLPKFDLDKKDYVDDHIKKFMLLFRLMNVDQKYVVYILSPFTFEGQYPTWYFSLRQGSIKVGRILKIPFRMNLEMTKSKQFWFWNYLELK